MRLLNATCSVIREGFVVQTPLSASCLCKAGLKRFADRSPKQELLLSRGWFPLGESKMIAANQWVYFDQAEPGSLYVVLGHSLQHGGRQDAPSAAPLLLHCS